MSSMAMLAMFNTRLSLSLEMSGATWEDSKLFIQSSSIGYTK